MNMLSKWLAALTLLPGSVFSAVLAVVVLSIAGPGTAFGQATGNNASNAITRTNNYGAVGAHADAQLAALLTEVTGVGPGKSLASKVELTQTYYAANDVPATS